MNRSLKATIVLVVVSLLVSLGAGAILGSVFWPIVILLFLVFGGRLLFSGAFREREPTGENRDQAAG